jgi:hypothetical protein
LKRLQYERLIIRAQKLKLSRICGAIKNVISRPKKERQTIRSILSKCENESFGNVFWATQRSVRLRLDATQ